jgi:fructose-1-phosphate kinase PfkB-like protein
MIVTVTLNPSLDRALSVPRFEPGTLHRAQFIRQDLGGKGINVAGGVCLVGTPHRSGWLRRRQNRPGAARRFDR